MPQTARRYPLSNNQGVVLPAPNFGPTLFVDAARGSDIVGSGFPNHPFASISRALAVAAAGTTIMVGPGDYLEALVVDKERISLLGSGQDAVRVLAPAASRALHVTTGRGFYAKQLRFVGSAGDTVIQNANDYRYEECSFDAAGGGAGLRLVGAAAEEYNASGGFLSLCQFRFGAVGLILQHAPAPSGIPVTEIAVAGCQFYGSTIDVMSAVNASGGGGGIFLRMLLKNCAFLTPASGHVYFDMDQGAAGDKAANMAMICDNFFAGAVTTTQVAIGGQPKVWFVGNYHAAGVIDGSTFNA